MIRYILICNIVIYYIQYILCERERERERERDRQTDRQTERQKELE